MAFIVKRKDSPYIYIGNYDKTKEKNKKYSCFATKLRKDVPADVKEAKQMIARIESGLQEHYLQSRFKTIGKPTPKLNDGLFLYYDFKIGLKEKTKNIYRLAVEHFIACNQDLQVSQYTSNHFSKFVAFLMHKGSSQHTVAIYLRHIKALFEYFVNEGYVVKNIVPTIKAPHKMVVAIPPKEISIILNYFKIKITDPESDNARAKVQYHLIKFLLLTGMRISSALVQTWENVKWDEGVMIATNVKANDRLYTVPLHKTLLRLLTEEMGAKVKGRLFDYSQEHGTPAFWKIAIGKMYDHNKITAKYNLHQLRKTFGTLVRRSGADLSTVQDLLNHSNIKVTAEHYTEDMGSTLYKNQLDNIDFGTDDNLGVPND